MEKRLKPLELTPRAIKDLQKVKSFNIDLFGADKAQEIIDNIFEEIEILEKSGNKFSQIGAVDEALSHLKRNYRKLFVHHCKVSYREGRTKIYIVRVFDTRQDPTKNK